jgi:AbrB family looped-hinge helix DNA binding protein
VNNGVISGIENGSENGRIYTMKSTIDSAGRIVLPKAIREAANLEGGTEVDVRIAGDHLEIEPIPADVSFVRKGDFVVAIPKRTPEKKLTVDVVEETRAQINREREGEPDRNNVSS